MIEDIKIYLEGYNYFITAQKEIEFNFIFRGFILKDQINASTDCRKYLLYNEVIIQESIKFYALCWEDRNRIYHSEKMQRELLTKQCKAMQEEFQESGDYQIMSYVTLHPIDTNNATNQYITEQIRCVNEMRRNKSKYKGKGIKEFLV